MIFTGLIHNASRSSPAVHAQMRYYLEDDTVDVTEPKQPNSGLPQVLPVLSAHHVARAIKSTERILKRPAEGSWVHRNSALS